jgi:hypothetical protein
MSRVVGVIRFAGLRAALSKVTVHVHVEETGRADAPATLLAERVLRGVDVVPGAAPLPFTVEGVDVPPRGRCTLRVHVDVDGDGEIGRGDWISWEACPVLSEPGELPVDVTVREVP